MDILKIIIIVSIAFIVSVLLVMCIKNCSVKEATIICRDCIKDILISIFAPTPPPKQYYPTVVAWNGSRIDLKLVDAAFNSVRDNFASCFCTQCGFSESQDIVTYHFELIRKPNSLEDNVLQELIQKQSEEVVTNTMHTYDCYLAAEPITYVRLSACALDVIFARTADGVKMLDELKQKEQRRKVLETPSVHDAMTETWGNKI